MTLRSDSVTWNDVEEIFWLLGTGYNVRTAKQIISSKPRPVYQLPVKDVASLVGSPGGMSFGVISVNWEAAKTADTSVPIIIATSKNGNQISIDGYHRIAKAVMEGLESLPCVVLNKTESRKVYL